MLHPLATFVSLCAVFGGVASSLPISRIIFSLFVIFIAKTIPGARWEALARALRLVISAFALSLLVAGVPAFWRGSNESVLHESLKTTSYFASMIAAVFLMNSSTNVHNLFIYLIKLKISPTLAYGIIQIPWMIKRMYSLGLTVTHAQLLRSTRFSSLQGRIWAYVTILPPVVAILATESIDRSIAVASRGLLEPWPVVHSDIQFGRVEVRTISIIAVGALICLAVRFC